MLAAEIQQLPTPPNDCVGKVLLLKVNDFTYSSKNYQLILVNLNDSSTITKSQRETEFKFKNLIPNNVYDVEVIKNLRVIDILIEMVSCVGKVMAWLLEK